MNPSLAMEAKTPPPVNPNTPEPPAITFLRETDQAFDVADALAFLDQLRMPVPEEVSEQGPSAESDPLRAWRFLKGSDLDKNRQLLLSLLDSAPVARLLCDRHGYFPGWQRSRPRLGFIAQPNDVDPRKPFQDRHYECDFTGRKFSLSFGAAVPVLFFDLERADGTDPCADESDPRDRVHHYVIHPALVCGGRETVVWAIHAAVSRALTQAATALDQAADLACLASGLTPEQIGGEDASWALERWESYVTEEGDKARRRVANGWCSA